MTDKQHEIIRAERGGPVRYRLQGWLDTTSSRERSALVNRYRVPADRRTGQGKSPAGMPRRRFVFGGSVGGPS